MLDTRLCGSDRLQCLYPFRGGTALLAEVKMIASLVSGLPVHAALFLAGSQQNGLRHQMKMLLTDPFSTVRHYWNWFDAALLIPYFLVMIVLAIYGVHRYQLCYLYFKYRKNYNPNPLRNFEELPRVTIQLPIFNEQFVIDRLVEAVCAIDYPQDKLEIQVLDDSTDETTEVAAAIVARYAALGHPIVYIDRKSTRLNSSHTSVSRMPSSA
jgi:hypothetical protein